ATRGAGRTTDVGFRQESCGGPREDVAVREILLGAARRSSVVRSVPTRGQVAIVVVATLIGGNVAAEKSQTSPGAA
ncbi:MAG: hypothetical protein KJO13_00270, partial [Gammaproteobacteria bacterium]|nr:hypothetical protein [Gammaproteobacteria bacterium]